MTESLILTLVSMKSAVVIFAACLLFMQSGWRDQKSVFLAGFLMLYGLINVDEIAVLTGVYDLNPHLLGIVFPLQLFLGPSFYFYARATVTNRQSWFDANDMLAFAAPIAAALVALPFYLLSGPEKLLLLSGEARHLEQYQLAMLGCTLGLALFVVMSIAYLLAAYQLVYSEKSIEISTDESGSSACQAKRFNVNRWLFVIVAVGWTISASSELLAIIGLWSRQATSYYHVFELTWIATIALFGISLQTQGKDQAAPFMGAESTPKSGSNLLSDDQHAQIGKLLNVAMEQHQLYLDPDLSLRKLSESIEIRENNISETFSRHFNKNFFDYVNGFRIEKARELLEGSDNSILSIALEVGFNSRSTFNTTFKRQTGVTPSQFRKETTLANSISVMSP